VARRLDPQLIGSWRPVDAATAGIVALNGDGTYRFASGIPADTGHWKVRDGVLFVRRRSSLTWLPLGGYSLAGDRLVLRPAADRPELIWRRQ
jgi:hypothetical protein